MPRRCRPLSLNCVTKHHLPSTFCNDLITLYANKWYQSSWFSDWFHDADYLEEGEVMVVLREACFCRAEAGASEVPYRKGLAMVCVVVDSRTPSTKNGIDRGCDDARRPCRASRSDRQAPSVILLGVQVEVELCNLGLLYKGTRDSQNRLDARQVRHKINFWGWIRARGRGAGPEWRL
jgi:hypothetical protein